MEDRMEPILVFDHVSFSYHTIKGETPAISDLSFSIEPGEFTVLVGPSGCGKSTLLSLACGLLEPEAGSVTLFGHDSARVSDRISPSDTPIGYMFQRDHLFEWRSLYRNAMLWPELHHKESAKIRERVDHLLCAYGLSDFTHQSPSQLSGGMRQRAALIRTLVSDPALLLLDEPFSALDYQTRLEVSNDIANLIRETGKTVLMVTHDLSEAVSIADRILVLSKRPCRLKANLKVEFPDHITSPEDRRAHPYFSQLFNTIWKELKADA